MAIFKNQGYTSITVDTGVNLTSATTTRINYTKPNGQTGHFTATVTDTTKLTYQFANNDLDSIGVWKFQAYVVIGGLNAYGEIVTQKIEKPL